MVLSIYFDSDIKCQPKKSTYNYFRFLPDKSIFETNIISSILYYFFPSFFPQFLENGMYECQFQFQFQITEKVDFKISGSLRITPL